MADLIYRHRDEKSTTIAAQVDGLRRHQAGTVIGMLISMGKVVQQTPSTHIYQVIPTPRRMHRRHGWVQ